MLASFHTPGTERLPNSLKYTSLKLSINPSSSNSHNQPIAHKEWTSRKRKKQHDQVLRFWIVRSYILHYNVRIIYSNSFWNMRNWMNLSGQELSIYVIDFDTGCSQSLHKYVSNWKICWSAPMWKHLATHVWFLSGYCSKSSSFDTLLSHSQLQLLHGQMEIIVFSIPHMMSLHKWCHQVKHKYFN